MKKVLLSVLTLLAFAASGIAQNLPSYVPANGLVGWWPFNGNANDESGNNNNGTVNGAILANDRFDHPSSSYFFNGNSSNEDYITCNNPLSSSEAFSLSYWIMRSDSQYNKWHLMISDNNPNNFTGSYELISVKDTIFFRNYAPAGVNFDVKKRVLVQDQTFFHICVTYNLNTTKLYINGVEEGASALPMFRPISGNFFIGKHANFNTSDNTAFNGRLDDIAIYNRALTQQEITNLYQGGNTSANCLTLPLNLQQGLLGYWPFCGNALDESGNGNNLVSSGNVSYDFDRFNNSLSCIRTFGAPNDYLFKDNANLPIGNTTRTVSMWYKILSISDGPNIFTYWPGANICNESFGLFGTYNGIYFWGECNDRYQDFSSTDSSWINIVVVYDNNFLKIFKNGIQLNSNSNTYFNFSTPLSTSNNKLIVGGRPENNNPNFPTSFNGFIDDIAIWNRALTQQEIMQLYNQGICQTSITVTDTLLIHMGITSYNPVAYGNTLKVWPNPGNQDITMDAGNLSLMQGWKVRVSNSLGQDVVQATLISQQQQTFNISAWGGNGLYLLHLINPQGHIVEVKKIVLAP